MNNKFLFAFIFVFVFSLSFVMAQGLELPNQFYGTATYNLAASTEMTVEAYIEGVKVGSTTTLNGQYGYDPLFLIKDNNGKYAGKTINFYLNSVDTGQTAVFENGASTKLDLSATGPDTGGNTGDTSSRRGSSSSSRDQSDVDIIKVNEGTGDSGEDKETLKTENQDDQETTSFFSRITGAVIGGGTARIIIPLIFIILIVWAVITVYIKRRATEVSSEDVEEVV